MNKNTLFKMILGRTATAAGILCAAVSWGDPVPDPAGPMSQYLVHCHSWMAYSAEACTRLAERLAAVETPSPAERLALLKAQGTLAREAGRDADDCSGLAAFVADHPDYAYGLYFRSYCVPWDAQGDGGESAIGLLLRAAEIEPDNYLVLQRIVLLEDGHPPEGERGLGGRVPVVDPGTLAAYREAMYEGGKARAAWWRTVLEDAEPDVPPDEDFLQYTISKGLLVAGSHIYAAAMGSGDLKAAEVIRGRLRRDLELDALDYGAEDAPASLALACQPALYGSVGLEDACLAGVEKLASRASAAGLPLPGYVLKAVDQAAYTLREEACAESLGVAPGGRLLIPRGGCLPEATETSAVRRLRAIMEHHGGPQSSEHHRVLAQGFLGGDDRLDGLRAALRADAGNARARCELATALAARGDSESAAALGGDPECVEYGDFAWGEVPASPAAIGKR